MHQELLDGNAPIAPIATSVTLHQEVQLLKWTIVNPFDKQQHLVHQLMLNLVIAWLHQTCINCKKNCTKSDLQHQLAQLHKAELLLHQNATIAT